MCRLAVALAMLVLLSGCDVFVAPPKLPELPPGAEELAGDGAWEVAYDNAVGQWLDGFEESRPFAIAQDYWLKTPTQPEEIFRRYDEALAGWTAEPYEDRRGRWVGKVYRKGGRMFTAAIFLKARHGADFDILWLLAGPKRWHDPQPDR